MKFANATNLNRKSGVAKWRDLLFITTPSNAIPEQPGEVPVSFLQA
jgi:hypothetical protein